MAGFFFAALASFFLGPAGFEELLGAYSSVTPRIPVAAAASLHAAASRAALAATSALAAAAFRSASAAKASAASFAAFFSACAQRHNAIGSGQPGGHGAAMGWRELGPCTRSVATPRGNCYSALLQRHVIMVEHPPQWMCL